MASFDITIVARNVRAFPRDAGNRPATALLLFKLPLRLRAFRVVALSALILQIRLMPNDGAMVKLATRGKPAEVSRQLARIPRCPGRQHRES